MDSQGQTTNEAREDKPSKLEEPKPLTDSAAAPTKTAEGDANSTERVDSKKKTAKDKSVKKKTKSKKAKKSPPVEETSSSDDTDDAALVDSSDLSDTDDSTSESEYHQKKRRVSKKKKDAQKLKKKARPKRPKKTAKARVAPESSSESGVSDSVDTSDEDDDGADDIDDEAGQQDYLRQLQLLDLRNRHRAAVGPSPSFPYGGDASIPGVMPSNGFNNIMFENPGLGFPPASGVRALNRGSGFPPRRNADFGGNLASPRRADGQVHKDEKKRSKAPNMDFKRVDQVWDKRIHDYKLQETAEDVAKTHYNEFLFHVRRTFDWEGKYKATFCDIKSKLLREALKDVIGDIKGVSLVEETPRLDPNMLFLYLEDIRKYAKVLKKFRPTKGSKRERKKEQKRVESKRQQLKVLVRYIDTDYADIKSSLYPMLANGLITFDLLWALWKPDTLAYTATYGSTDEPRAYKVEMAERHRSIVKGDYYYVEGKYFEYDGKQFGFGTMSEEIGEFRGARKITSLSVYPLKYHRSEERVRKELIERGKKFAGLGGVHYKSHQGMAYLKKKKAIVKVNINGRIMVDPAVHRRINPNYQVSQVKAKDHDILSDDEGSDAASGCGCASDSEGGPQEGDAAGSDEGVKLATKVFRDQKGNIQFVRVEKPNDEDQEPEELDKLPVAGDECRTPDNDDAQSQVDGTSGKKKAPEFTDEEYLIASPVVLGFAFAEKLWLEFTVSGIKEIAWNEKAYDSLVLEAKTKDIVKALVESHKYHAAESIDDVIQGKGKGLVAVLHGPPGTGKTLTAEGISELLKCPLYMVSAGELGTDSRYLEAELQKILDICHAWGAILLLDEADVFMEKRNMHDIHRNALVSIFLRQLEYFQGILFLTTNRVETFDDAFQSRIHIALRYDSLDHKAKKAIFKIFIERVRVQEGTTLNAITEEDFNQLARYELNGRQIKNMVSQAKAFAVARGEPLAMSHIREVLDVQMRFDRDLKGGPGFQDAMRNYF